jgi:hypothetical protein
MISDIHSFNESFLNNFKTAHFSEEACGISWNLLEIIGIFVLVVLSVFALLRAVYGPFLWDP